MAEHAVSSDQAHDVGKAGSAMGVLLMALGVLSVMAPLVSGIAIELLVGAALLVGGIAECVHGGRLRHGGVILAGCLTALCGALMVLHPLAGLGFLTLLMAVYFVVNGIGRIAMGMKVRPHAGWGLVAFGGVMSVALGVLIYVQWPMSGTWAVGTLAGISMIFSGSTLMAIGRALRSAAAGPST